MKFPQLIKWKGSASFLLFMSESIQLNLDLIHVIILLLQLFNVD